MNGSQLKGKIFTDVVFISCPKDATNVLQAMEHTLNKTLFIILPNLACFFKEISAFHTCILSNIKRKQHKQEYLHMQCFALHQ